MTKLFGFALILITTKSKWVTEDSKNMKRSFAKEKC